ncbi:ADP-ribose pyrophosphatase [Fibrobacterales bacterium]|nr:ADP-ribose pyrophosphatase [Fibrobacterales bacterium]
MNDFLIYIGRFEPPHCGHLSIIRRALEQTNRLLLFIGSHEVCRSLRNPFTTAERIEMLKISLTESEISQIDFIPIHDSNYNYREWVKEVNHLVACAIDKNGCTSAKPNIGIIGHKKDDTSYYLDLFPEWNFVEMPLLENGISSSEIRKKWFGENLTEKTKIPQAIYGYLKNKETEQWFKDLKKEFELVNDYKKSWAASPYPPVFIAGDSCVICNEHILLIKRAAFPGKGLFSLPGGFLEQNESIRHCAIRELLEETGIEISEKELTESITDCKIFDDPNREPRGRMISHCFLFNLTQHSELPAIKANDDAASALWFPVKDIDKIRSQFAGDHYKVVRSITIANW